MERELIELTEEEVASLLRIYPTIKWDELSEAGKMTYTILYRTIWSPDAIAWHLVGGDRPETQIFKVKTDKE